MNKIGESYFRTPRNTIKGFLDLLSVLEQYPDKRWTDIIEEIDIKEDKEISDLGSVYKFEKISDYYNIINRLDIVNREDKLYIDTTNVDEFKKGFDEYFKDLNEDINTIVDITTLPTSLVNKVGIVVATSLAAGIVLFFTLRKRKFM